MIKFPTVGLLECLKYALGIKPPPTKVIYKLYTDAHDFDLRDTLDTFTELAGALYTPLQVLPANWTTSVTAGDPVSATAPQTPWMINGACSVTGYYVVNGDDGSLLFEEPFSGGPLSFGTGGGKINFTPYLSDGNLTVVV
jgi:hypothetical protein